MEDNKYLFEIQNLDDDERRERRRRKRLQKRRRAWTLLSVLIVLAVCLGIGTFIFLHKSSDISINIPKPIAVEEVKDNSEEIQSAIEKISDGEEEVTVEPPKPVEVEPTEAELFEDAIRSFVQSMSIEEQVAGLFIVTPESLTGVETVTRAGDGTKTAIEKYPVGGIIYSDKNMTSQEQFMEVVENTRSYAKYPLFLAIDEELGNTAFSSSMNNTATMKPSEIAALADPSIGYIEEEKIASYMSGLGLNLNIGVVADVVSDDSSFMQEKSFGSDTELVGGIVAKAVGVLDTYGINSAVKYFPGQGMTGQDPSAGRSVSVMTRDDFDNNDLKTFTAGIDAGADMVIVSHVIASDFTGEEVRCSASKYVMTEILRKELGYDDLIIVTDSLSKDAVSNYEESGAACIASIKAGADMVMCPEDFETAYEEVLNAANSGVIARERIEDSLVRIYKSKFKALSYEEIKEKVPGSFDTETSE